MAPGTSRLSPYPLILVVPLLSAVAACSSQTGNAPTALPTGSSSASSVAADALDGRWSTGSVLIDDIRAAMLSAGLEPDAVEGWTEEQGSPSEFTFELQFDSPTFTHSVANPHMAMQVSESGTYEFDGDRLRFSLTGQGQGDAYLFDATLANQTLSLDLVDMTEQGTAEDLATHRLYTVAFYASAPFVRQP